MSEKGKWCREEFSLKKRQSLSDPDSITTKLTSVTCYEYRGY
jgi:hypothetical protein